MSSHITCKLGGAWKRGKKKEGMEERRKENQIRKGEKTNGIKNLK